VTVGRGLYGVLEKLILIRVVVGLRGFVANDSGPGWLLLSRACVVYVAGLQVKKSLHVLSTV